MAQRSIFERFGLFKIRVNNHFIYSMQEPVYGEEYLCFYNDEYIGSATFTEGPFIGDCFILWEVHKTQGLPQVAIMPDKWILKTGQDH